MLSLTMPNAMALGIETWHKQEIYLFFETPRQPPVQFAPPTLFSRL